MAELMLYGYGFDIGPWGNIKLVGEYASRRPGSGWTAKVLGNQPLGLSPEDFLRPLPDVLLIGGPSSFKNDEELALIELAGRCGIPIAVLCDTHRSFARPPAKGEVDCTVAIVASACEVAAAEAFGYKGAAYLGGPPAWQDWWGLTERHPSPDPLFTIYAEGVKSVPVTTELVRAVGAGTKLALDGTPWKFIFRPHPNEATGTDAPRDEAERDAWAEDRRRALSGLPLFNSAAIRNKWGAVCPSSVNVDGDAALCGAHVSFFTSGGTSTIKAAMNRKVCGYYESRSVRERMLAQTGEETWWPAEPETWAVCKVTTAEEVAALIANAQFESWRTELKARQEAAYPEPERPAPRVEGRILDFLAGLALGA